VAAEGMFTYRYVKHDLFFCSGYCLSEQISHVFAGNLPRARTKCESIAVNVLGPPANDELFKDLCGATSVTPSSDVFIRKSVKLISIIFKLFSRERYKH
jgi:hypothetical protein